VKDGVDACPEDAEYKDDKRKQQEAANLPAAFRVERLSWVLVCDGGSRCFV
jgi:hypothetical protein